MEAAYRSLANSISRDQRGQIVVEYVLLLVVGVAVSFLITTQMVSRSTDNTGFLVKKWVSIIKAIGSDYADDAGEN